MNLLLLLSALLSALTGAGSGARGVQAEQAISRPVLADAAVGAARAIAIVRPPTAAPILTDLARAPLTASWRLLDDVPLFLSRRRE